MYTDVVEPTLVAAPDICVCLEMPVAQNNYHMVFEWVPFVGTVITRHTFFGPMQFVRNGVTRDIHGHETPLFTIPRPAPAPELESIWNGLDSLIGERDEQTAPVYALGDAASSQEVPVTGVRLAANRNVA
jgi:hypothetical protein